MLLAISISTTPCSQANEKPICIETLTEAIEQLEIKTEQYKELTEFQSTEYDSTLEWFEAYLEFSQKYNNVKIEYLEDCFTDEELYYLYRTVETETYQADFDSKAHVASVVFNRLRDGRFGNDLVSIITKKNQFSYKRTTISEDTKLACQYAFVIGDTTNGALFFDNNSRHSKKYNFIFEDNVKHKFYTDLQN